MDSGMARREGTAGRDGAEAWSGAVTVEPFDYAAKSTVQAAGWGNWEIEEVDETGTALKRPEEAGARGSQAAVLPEVDFERRLEEEVRRGFEAGRERGRQEGRAAEREACAAERQGGGLHKPPLHPPIALGKP